MAKIGIECEGEFQGERTLFVDVNEFKQILNKKMPHVKQLYISDHKNELNLFDPDLSYIANVEYKKITIERTKFDSAPFWINVMLVIDNESFWNLRGQDQIKFSKDLTVYAVQKKSMPYTTPVEFQSDVDFDLSKLEKI